MEFDRSLLTVADFLEMDSHVRIVSHAPDGLGDVIDPHRIRIELVGQDDAMEAVRLGQPDFAAENSVLEENHDRPRGPLRLEGGETTTESRKQGRDHGRRRASQPVGGLQGKLIPDTDGEGYRAISDLLP